MRVVHLARKPLAEASVAMNVEIHGTGGINVDAGRIGSGGEHFRALGGTVSRVLGGMVDADTRTGGAAGMFDAGNTFVPTNHPGGRYPANLVIGHAVGCERVSKDGEPDRWSCIEGCPSMDLDRSAADRVSRYFKQVGR